MTLLAKSIRWYSLQACQNLAWLAAWNFEIPEWQMF